MKFSEAIDVFVDDWRAAGRLNSDNTERAYRFALNALCDDVKNRPVDKIGREDVKRCLTRWSHPNTVRARRAVFVAFFTYWMEEGVRKDNPALQTRQPRPRKPTIYRLTREEAAAMLNVAKPGRERRVITLQMCAGLRVGELIGAQGRHFKRPGWVWVSQDIAKGQRERWIPVIDDLADVVAEIGEYVEPDQYVVPFRMAGGWGLERKQTEDPRRPTSRTTVNKVVKDVAERAGIVGHVSAHTCRHAFGDHVARGAGLLVAQALLGHSRVDTTRGTYVGDVSLDELDIALRGFSFLRAPRGTSLPTRSETA